MTILSRWLAPTVLAAAVGIGAWAPAPAQAQDSLTRVLVDVADVIFNNGVPYYRYGDPGYNSALIAMRDRYGRPLYYRQVPSGYNARQAYDPYGRRLYDGYGRRINYSNVAGYRNSPPYGNAYGYRANRCNGHGKCRAGSYRGGHRRDDDRDHRRERGDD